MSDRYSGDPRVLVTSAGADLDYRGGQPVMDAGLENQAILSLFTRRWCGNIFLPPASRIGSDFEDTCRGAITLEAVNADIPNAAERALKSDLFSSVAASVANPSGNDLRVMIKLGRGVLSLDRKGMLWVAQATDPAYRRLT